MTETFNFDFFQIPHSGPNDEDTARTDVSVSIMRPCDSKLSNFGAKNVGSALAHDKTKTDYTFETKDNLSDVNVITADTGIGQNVRLNSINVNHNPLLAGSTVKYTRDDQFIRMSMSKESDAYFGMPMADVMDTNVATAAGINASTNATLKNWPTEGWRTYGGKYDFLPYAGGVLK